MRQVVPYSLWLGHVGHVRNLGSILDAGITALVDLAPNEPPAKIARDLIYCRFPLVDGPGNPPWLLRLAVETTAALVRARVRTLVFCGAGMSRSPAIAAAAVARVSGRGAEECLVELLQGAPRDVTPALWQDVRSALSGPASTEAG